MTRNLGTVYMFGTLTVLATVMLACQPPKSRYDGAQATPTPKPLSVPFSPSKTSSGATVDSSTPPELPTTPDGQMTPSELATHDGMDAIPLDLKEQCATQICGDPAKTFTPSDITRGAIDANAEAESTYSTQLRPLIEKKITAQIDEEQKLFARFGDARDRLTQVQLSQQETALLNGAWMLSTFDGAATAFKRNGKTIQVDEQQLATALPQLSASDLAWDARFLADFVNSSEFDLAQSLSSAPLRDYLIKALPNVSADESRKQLGNELATSIQALRQSFPGLPIPAMPSIDALRAGQDLTPDLVQDLQRAVIFSYLETAATKGISLYGARPIDVPATVTAFYDGGTLARHTSEIGDGPRLTQFKTKTLEVCHDNIVRAYAAAPTQAEIMQANLMIATAKKNVIAVTRTMNLTNDVQKRVETQIGDLDFQMPSTREQLMSSYSQTLQRSADEIAAREAAAPMMNDHALFVQVFSATLPGQRALLSNIAGTCDQFAPKAISDRAMTELGSVLVSWQSVKFPRYGLGVISHELGHVVSSALQVTDASKSQPPSYVSLRGCTIGRHSDQVQDTVEEDFADLIAARSMKLMGDAGTRADNFGCLLIGENNTRWGSEEGLSTKWTRDITFTHSPSFYRLLQVQMNSSRELPQSCQKIIDTYIPASKMQCGL